MAGHYETLEEFIKNINDKKYEFAPQFGFELDIFTVNCKHSNMRIGVWIIELQQNESNIDSGLQNESNIDSGLQKKNSIRIIPVFLDVMKGIDEKLFANAFKIHYDHLLRHVTDEILQQQGQTRGSIQAMIDLGSSRSYQIYLRTDLTDELEQLKYSLDNNPTNTIKESLEFLMDVVNVFSRVSNESC